MRRILVVAFLAWTVWGACMPRDAMALDLRAWNFAAEEAICYSPYRAGQRPGTGAPSEVQLREDLEILTRQWRVVRTYGCVEFGDELLRIARADERDLRFVVGAWIAPDAPEANRAELETAIRLANEYPELVAAVCVGNETQVSWSAHRSSAEQLMESIREVRARVAVPVTTADDYKYWVEPESRAVAREVDFVFYHAHPLWNGILLEDSIDWLRQTTERVRALHPDRPVVLGEIGWATSVADHGEQAQLIRGKAGQAEQARFRATLHDALPELGVTAFWFEAFDESWKGGSDPSEVEKHWGLYFEDRSPKAAARTKGAPE